MSEPTMNGWVYAFQKQHLGGNDYWLRLQDLRQRRRRGSSFRKWMRLYMRRRRVEEKRLLAVEVWLRRRGHSLLAQWTPQLLPTNRRSIWLPPTTVPSSFLRYVPHNGVMEDTAQPHQ